MMRDNSLSERFILPLPAFVLHPATALFLAAMHIYLATAHLLNLVRDPLHWTDVWKAFGALAGAYVFAALASRGLAQREKASRRTLDRGQDSGIFDECVDS